MGVYYIELGFIVLCIILCKLSHNAQVKLGSNYIFISKKNIFLSIICISLILISGFRYYVGTDYSSYVSNYNNYKTLEFHNLGNRIIAIVSSWIKDDYSTWFFLMALITIGLSVYAISKYSNYWELTIILYLLMGYWHSSFNIVKQCAAIAIIIAFQKYLFNKQFFKWALICLFASLFHISAILLIPAYFLITRDFNIKQIFIIVVTGIIVRLGYVQLFYLMSFLKSGNGIESITSTVGYREVNTLRVIVNVLPVIFVLFFKNEYSSIKLKSSKNTVSNFHEVPEKAEFYNEKLTVWSNCTLLNAVLWVAASNSVYLTRFCSYTGIFNIFFIPFAMEKFEKRTRIFIVSILTICYLCFWIYDLSKGSTTAQFHWIFER